MTLAALRPVATGVRPGALVIGLALAGFGLLAASVLGSAIWSWWAVFDYVPAPAQVRDARYYSVPYKGRQIAHTAFTYSYQSGGAEFEGSGDIEGTSIDAGQTIALWIDPALPRRTVLTRRFAWWQLLLVPIVMLFFMPSLTALFARDDLMTRPARALLVRADPDGYRLLLVVAALVSLAGWPLAAIAAVQFSRGDDPAWILGLFLLPVGGALLAATALRRRLIRQRLGTPLLEIWPNTVGELKARVHFQPPLASRCDATFDQIPVRIQVAQVQRASRGKSAEARNAWVHRVEAMLARGSAHADFRVAIPDWPKPFLGVEAACWKISVMALGATAHFRLAPDIIRGGPASTT